MLRIKILAAVIAIAAFSSTLASAQTTNFVGDTGLNVSVSIPPLPAPSTITVSVPGTSITEIVLDAFAVTDDDPAEVCIFLTTQSFLFVCCIPEGGTMDDAVCFIIIVTPSGGTLTDVLTPV